MKKQRAKKPETVTKRGSGGSDFERTVRKILRDFSDRGLCRLWKLPTDMRLVRGGVLAYGEPMPADFMGFNRQGRCVLIECKDVNRKRLPLGKSPGLTPHQLQAMRFAYDSNSLYIVLWKRGEKFSGCFRNPGLLGYTSLAWDESGAHPLQDLQWVLLKMIMHA